MQPGYLKLGLFALRLSLHSSPNDEQDLPLIFFRTSHLRRYFHEQDDPYPPYATAKYSDYRANKKRWEERQAEERSEVERMDEETTERGRKCVAVERWRALETCLAVRRVEEWRRLRKGERAERFQHRNVRFA